MAPSLSLARQEGKQYNKKPEQLLNIRVTFFVSALSYGISTGSPFLIPRFDLLMKKRKQDHGSGK